MISYFITDNWYNFAQKLSNKYFGNDLRVANFGCGETIIPGFLESSKINKAWGFDNDQAIIKKNNYFDIDLDKDKVPFRDNYFDLVLSIWAVEHFKTNLFLSEAGRILKKRGKLMIITPNVYHPFFLLNRFLPYKLSGFLRKKFLRIAENYPSYYNFNSFSVIRKEASINNFDIEKIYYLGPANILNYFSAKSFKKILFLAEYLINNRFLYWLKPTMLIILEKN